MAMNKSELATLEEARRQAAFRRTMPVDRDVPVPKSGAAGMSYSEGWDFNTHTLDVRLCWSTSVSHGYGPAPKPGQRHTFGSQGGLALFSSKERALRALRWSLEEDAARTLRKVDKAIEAATAEAGASS